VTVALASQPALILASRRQWSAGFILRSESQYIWLPSCFWRESSSEELNSSNAHSILACDTWQYERSLVPASLLIYLLSYTLSLPVYHRPQTTRLHPALHSATVSIFLQLNLKPTVHISFSRSLFRVFSVVLFLCGLVTSSVLALVWQCCHPFVSVCEYGQLYTC